MTEEGSRTIRDRRDDAERREKAENGTVKKRNARAREIVTIKREAIRAYSNGKGHVRAVQVGGGREQRETKQDRTRRSDSTAARSGEQSQS